MDSKRPIALITGGARRVGREIVQTLADAGHDIAFTYLSSQDEARELSESIQARGGRAIAIPADLTQPEAAVARIAAEFRRNFGRLDVLVNSASIYKTGTLAQTDSTLMRTLFAIHFDSPLLLCRQFADLLRASNGHVINMIDLLAEKPWPEYMAYCASKAALANLTLSLARELAPQVTVNGIAPGIVEWPPDLPQQQRDQYLRRVPLARAGTPDDVAKLVLYLCTAGTYITGQIIRLDGGRSIT